jgi:hypothetical protein
MAKLLKFQQKLVAEGYCDERGAGFCATVTRWPGGMRGVVCLCVQGSLLNVYDVNIKSELKDRIFQFRLNEITALKIRMNIFSQKLQFKYGDNLFSFTNFLGVRSALDTIKEESMKKEDR